MKYDVCLILTDWAYENCVGNNAPCGFIPWGYGVVEADDIAVYRTICGNVVRETEKAVCIQYSVGLTDSRCNVYKTIKWNNWIPKSQIVHAENVHYFDGGMSQYVDAYIYGLKKPIKKTNYTRA